MLETSEAQAIRQELTEVIRMVTNITGRLERRQAYEDTDKRTKDALQDRIVFLEAEATRLRDENTLLKVDNAKQTSRIDDMANCVHLQGLEIEKLIEERDDALERLEKVESLFKQVFHGEKQATPRPSITTDRKRYSPSEVARDKGKQSEKSMSWSSGQASSRASTPLPSGTSGSIEKVVKAKSTSSHSSPLLLATPSSSIERGLAGFQEEKLPGREWYIETKSPPATACVAKGPFVLSDLAERLGMTAGEVMKLEKKVIRSNRLGPRLHVYKNCMFVFDPMWLELAEHTCLVDWSEKDVADEIRDYTRRKIKQAAAFHVFSYPLHMEGWYYFGPHKVQHTELLELWPQLRQEEKDTFETRMKERRQEEMVEGEKMKQTTIEVWGMSEGENVARRFVEKHGL